MNIRLHRNARTTPAIRMEIQRAPSSISDRSLARKYNLRRATMGQWRKRNTVEDGSHRPHKLHTQLSPAEE